MRGMMHGWRLKGRERAREQETERERVREMRDTVMMHSYMQIISFCLSLLLALSLSLSRSFSWQQQQWQQQQQQWQQQRQHWHFAGIWLCRHLHKDPNQRLPYPNGIVLIQQTEARKAEQTMPKQDAALLVHACTSASTRNAALPTP